MSKTSFEKAKDFIIKAGFSHIKIEMEADLGREDSNYECTDCYGEGTHECSTCNGSGYVDAERPNGTSVEVECDECNGEGSVECTSCEGSGRCETGEHWDEETCEDWIKDHVSVAAKNALTYSKFYYDGSVDSEMTLTIPVKNAEYLIEYLEAFKALSVEIGNGLETGGAGLHLCVIPAVSNGNYPAPRNALNSDKWSNFQSQVTKLLPALFMLASADDVSRPLNYRKPQISSDDKYSAIFAVNRSSIEYRLFETCYNNPDMVMEYVEIIANTLKFYDNPSLEVETLNKTVTLGDNREYKVSRFYQTPENIMVLRKQLKYIKPEGRSISDLMKSRKVPNITELRKINIAKVKQIREQYKKELETFKILDAKPLNEYQQDKLDNIKRRREDSSSYYYHDYRQYSDRELELMVKSLNPVPEFTEFLSQKLGSNTLSNRVTLIV